MAGKKRKPAVIRTIADVARTAGVSPATVSRVLNRSDYVKARTRERVERVIRASGFVPSKAAKSLGKGGTDLVGLIVPDVGNPVYLDILKGVSEASRERHYSVVLGQYGENESIIRESVLHLASLNVDGIVLSIPEFHRVDPRLYILPFVSHRIPIVQTGFAVPEFRIDAVGEHAEQTGRLAGAHLARSGYEHIVVLGSTENPFTKGRLEGFQSALREFGIPAESVELVDAELTVAGGHAAASALLAREPRPDAVFALNDVTAIGVLMAAAELGIAVPGRLGVIGVDGIQLGTLVQPRLSTVSLPTLEIGKKLFELLYERMSGAYQGEARQLHVEGRLCARESTVPLKTARAQ